MSIEYLRNIIDSQLILNAPAIKALYRQNKNRRRNGIQHAIERTATLSICSLIFLCRHKGRAAYIDKNNTNMGKHLGTIRYIYRSDAKAFIRVLPRLCSADISKVCSEISIRTVHKGYSTITGRVFRNVSHPFRVRHATRISGHIFHFQIYIHTVIFQRGYISSLIISGRFYKPYSIFLKDFHD